MRHLLRRFGAYVLPLAIGFALNGCDSGTTAPGPYAPTPISINVTPTNGSTNASVAGRQVTARASINQDYSSATGNVIDPYNVISYGSVYPGNSGEFFMATRPLDVLFTTVVSGTYTSSFTFNAGFGQTGTSGASFYVNVSPSRASGGTDPQVDPEYLADSEPVFSNKCNNNICSPPPPPHPPLRWLYRLSLPNKSHEPFFRITNDNNGTLTRAEMEYRASTWSPATRAQMAAFYSEVYDEDIYDLARSAPGYSDSDDRAARLRAAASALDLNERRQDGVRWADAVDLVLAQLGLEQSGDEGFEELAALRSVTQSARVNADVNDSAEVTMSTYPNPATRRLSVRVPAEAETVYVFDLLGRQVARLISSSGAAEWDLRDESGRRVSAGVYSLQTDLSGGRVVRQVTIL